MQDLDQDIDDMQDIIMGTIPVKDILSFSNSLYQYHVFEMVNENTIKMRYCSKYTRGETSYLRGNSQHLDHMLSFVNKTSENCNEVSVDWSTFRD